MSREMVQQTPVVRTIRDALVKRILKDLGKLADQPAEAPPADTEDAQAGAPAERPYDVFWRSFGILLKEGHYHDRARYGDRILPLLRFNTLHDADAKGLRSLAEIKASLPEGQDTLWYLTAPSREAALASPHLEAFRKKGFNVLLLTDVVDEWFIQGLEEAEGLPVKSVSRGALDLDPDDEADADNGEKEAGKAAVEQLAPWLQGLFGGELAGVRPSSRLTDSPAVLVDDDSGLSANMERILRAANQEVGKARRHLEINPQHPLIRNLARLHADGRDADAEPLARLLLDDALLLEGAVPDPAAVGRRLRELLVRASEAAIGRT
jgi:molecular chaperone HtpG